MRIFITGANGFIGSVITEKLQAQGHTIIALTRSDGSAAVFRQRGVTPLRGSVEDTAILTQGARQADAVIHLALSRKNSVPTDQQAIEALIAGLKGSQGTLIYTSGVMVTGDTGSAVTDETAPLDLKSAFGWRGQHELLVLEAASQGIRPLVIRPASIVYGRSGGGMVRNLFAQFQRYGAVPYIGTGETRKSPVHVDDLADLYLRALEHSQAGEVYIGASKEVFTMKSLAEAVARAAGAEGKTLSWTAEEAHREISFLADLEMLTSVVSSAKAERVLGWLAKGQQLIAGLESGAYQP